MISVVVCTRDRARMLERCLRHMADTCRGADLAWQLVIVDNASVDDTRAVAKQFATVLPLCYVQESRRGLSHARNRGVSVAKHSIIAFTDDDCLVAPDWLRSIVDEFARHPEASILGGRVELADPGDHPVSIRRHAREEAITTIDQIMALLAGCNMAFRRGVFDDVGRFDTAFGKGKHIGAGEDLDFLYRALKHGHSIRYSPEVLVRHAHGRHTADALQTLAHDYLKGRGAFYCKFITDRQIAQRAYWEFCGLARQWVRDPLRSGSPRALGSLATGAFYQCVAGTPGTAQGTSHAVPRGGT